MLKGSRKQNSGIFRKMYAALVIIGNVWRNDKNCQRCFPRGKYTNLQFEMHETDWQRDGWWQSVVIYQCYKPRKWVY